MLEAGFVPTKVSEGTNNTKNNNTKNNNTKTTKNNNTKNTKDKIVKRERVCCEYCDDGITYMSLPKHQKSTGCKKNALPPNFICIKQRIGELINTHSYSKIREILNSEEILNPSNRMWSDSGVGRFIRVYMDNNDSETDKADKADTEIDNPKNVKQEEKDEIQEEEADEDEDEDTIEEIEESKEDTTNTPNTTNTTNTPNTTNTINSIEENISKNTVKNIDVETDSDHSDYYQDRFASGFALSPRGTRFESKRKYTILYKSQHCRYYQKQRCLQGDNCRHYHEGEDDYDALVLAGYYPPKAITDSLARSASSESRTSPRGQGSTDIHNAYADIQSMITQFDTIHKEKLKILFHMISNLVMPS